MKDTEDSSELKACRFCEETNAQIWNTRHATPKAVKLVDKTFATKVWQFAYDCFNGKAMTYDETQELISIITAHITPEIEKAEKQRCVEATNIKCPKSITLAGCGGAFKAAILEIRGKINET